MWKNEKIMARLNLEDNRRAVYSDSPEKEPLLDEQK
jgi:hypothetical protein